ncbi:MAG: hypothetical protein UW69_C0002G0026 [Microgenomates group bacterium GW2011_GWA2_44_7]|uniref:Type II secretion system protein GspG C-terminal domain-containing protein n=1 Tax=Candidatus Woesebacteria bacterium GW2011_GWA1_43_12 TaxID=1618557 RepID=A0A0G1CXX5_9BACT|nr:MAG: hypothetical protein UV66_C0004G0026 [Candidatus Woesebacteria bacterium GW2011_GWA1_43_12]KKT76268.1 MAG: hypothetical protein UW69_C0002G0026 [Microgenomates group bacterium GW2011_GWA2_44_7]KKT77743.1 MAG: hypothetical protein UW73_C0013G0026 [Microgenomates group bacterium GW2011_GWB1_44_8]
MIQDQEQPLLSSRVLQKGFTKPEFLFVMVVLLILGLVSFYNFRLSEAKARDTHRAEEISRLSDALIEYYYDNNRYPLSDTKGKIRACGDNFKDPEVCNWGQKLYDYIELPNDPLPQQRFYYEVDSDGEKFKLWAAMETRIPVDFGLGNDVPWCGSARCNYGQGSSETVMSERF